MTTPADLSPLIDDLALSYRFRAAIGEGRGLVVLLHGVGSNETALAGLAALLPQHIAAALVRSPIPMGPSAYCAFAVNFTPAGPVIDDVAAETSRQKFSEFIGQLQARTGIPSSRTLVGGFSQGGIMSASVALTRPELVAGFAILSGRILPELEPLIAKPEDLAGLDALILHGNHDATLPVAWAERSATLLARLGVPFRKSLYPARHEISADMAGEFVAWSRRLLPA